MGKARSFYAALTRLYPAEFRREFGSVAIGDDEIGGGALVVYNAVGVPAMIGAVAFLIAGVLAPRHRAPTA